MGEEGPWSCTADFTLAGCMDSQALANLFAAKFPHVWNSTKTAPTLKAETPQCKALGGVWLMPVTQQPASAVHNKDDNNSYYPE